MDSVTSKSGSFLYAIIAILIILGAIGPIIGLDFIPLWVSIIFWTIALGLLFSIRKITFEPDAISTLYFLTQRTTIIKNLASCAGSSLIVLPKSKPCLNISLVGSPLFRRSSHS